MIARGVPGLLAPVLLLLALLAEAAPRLALPDAAWLHRQVEELAAPGMEGRASATPGGERAARYLVNALATGGLTPGGDDRTFLQSFVVATGTRLADSTTLESLTPVRSGLAAGREFMPHGGSRTGEVAGDVLLAGHGLVAPDRGTDDYAGLDARGKIVTVLTGAPAGWQGPVPSRLDRLIAARARGAAALLIVDDRLPTLNATATRVDLPSATLTRDAATAWLRPAGVTVEAMAGGRRGPAPLPMRARLRVALASEDRRAANVVGVLPGTDPALAREVVVVGAHYDHLGIVGGVLHPGADDNASGTALVLGLARAFASAGGLPRTLAFVLFSGEEVGLLGSRHYVTRAGSGIERVVAMLNFDMVGRVRAGRLAVAGVESGRGLREAVADAARAEAVTLALGDTPFAPSDHMRFYAAGAPVLFFSTGRHDDYHRPSDTAEKIDADGMARIARVAARVIARLAQERRPTYVKLDRPERRRTAEHHAGAEAFLGIMADAGAEGDGVKVADVVPESTAARLGLAEGDVIVRFGGVPVNAFAELLDAVRGRRPGERVQVVYLREGAARAGAETLGARP